MTAKEIAKALKLSEAAVSMALNQKKGVSEDTRRNVIAYAEEHGYDFSRIRTKQEANGTIFVVLYRTSNAILSYAPIFDELCEGIRHACAQESFKLRITQLYEKTDDLELQLEELRLADCIGLILIGTEMRKEVCRQFLTLPFPVVLLDTNIALANCDCVLINNMQGAFDATDYLISRTGKRPGYLRSSYRIPNFEERESGYRKALRENGFSSSDYTAHELSPTLDGAFADMLEILDSGIKPQRCYFAENDILAIGALKALRLRGFRIPDDVAIIGFDNISESRIVDPALTTMDVPRYFMAEAAARQLFFRIRSKQGHAMKIEVSPALLKRFSV